MLLPVRDDAVVVESVRVPAGPYLLEGELAYPDQEFPRAGVVVAGPHPLLGGTMPSIRRYVTRLP